jgi:class 3 adenylate cyclase
MDDGGAYTRALVGFVKAYLKAASLVIAEPGIGRIDKFIGDGIMATFGEYVVCSGKTKDEEKANKSLVAGLLGLYTSAMLHNAFEKLRDRLFDHPAVKRFLSEFNDSINIELGVGMNYGDVWFDFFGSSGSSEGSDSNFLGGYLEYTAVGDHVNAAQRLESLASKAASAVSLIARGPGREERTPNFIAPIVLSRTVFVRVRGALQPPPKSRGRSLEEHYRSAFALKGKGSVVEAYEVFPDEINGDNLILRLTELTSRKLANSVRKTWLSDKRGFDFDEAIANDLAAKCFPAS